MNISNMALLTDFYELTMMNGYLNENMADDIVYFEYFFRKIPDNGGFAISCGLESVCNYIDNLKFTDEDIEYLKNRNIFTEKFIDEIKKIKFTGDIWAVKEGTPIFPYEPIIVVRARAFEAQLIETAILLFMNHQSLICTKANRIVRAAEGRDVLEFGSRRAQGKDAAILGARAAYIGGCAASSNTIVDSIYGVKATGTMAHSWVQMFETEYDAFKAYAKNYPDTCSLLIDTYDVLNSGIKNAVRVFDEVLKPLNKRPLSVRLDSGDIAYLSKKVRRILDEAGYEDCKIVASNSLDEVIIKNLILEGAKVDIFGVGEKLITAYTNPVFGGVYKLVATQKNGKIVNKIKISENIEKITTPGFKQFYRLYDNETKYAMADLVTFHSEVIDESKPLEIFHPSHTWKRKTLKNFRAEKMLHKIYEGGKLIYDLPSIEEIRSYCLTSLDNFWDEMKRFEFPHKYIVDLSYDLWKTKNDMLKKLKD
ncbi:MAG: nicotinate phosphoribosyltransferase [Clostridiales bacterium]|nr:MAG: nicotinate phosphoribosyltransferase [Clostridiales bacterium]